MTLPRPCSVLIFAVILAPAIRAQEKPAPSWLVDRALSVSPRKAPVPALTYFLTPPIWELKEGNAVPIYLRLVHEQSDAARKYWLETPKPWNLLPVDKIPLEEARKFLQDRHYLLRQIEVGARRRSAEWNYTLEEPNPIGLLLPDVQVMRNYVPMLVLQARVALAEGDFKGAAHHLETDFAFSRHIAEGPTLINSLVAVSLASQFASATADFIEQPNSPNLYWALAALPRPLIDLRKAMGFEYQTLEKQYPELADLDRERTPEQWDSILRHIRTELRGLALMPAEGGNQKLPDWLPNDWAPEIAAAKSPDLAEARKFVARVRGLAADKVEAMPPAQVLLLYMVGTYQVDRDDFFRASYLPYPRARPLFAAADKRLLEAPISEAHIPARLLLPGLMRVMGAQVRLERNLGVLRVIEALRMHAAAHNGKLPDKLDEVTEVPIPHDPGTGGPFEYSREGDTATLVSKVPGDPPAKSGLRFRVTIRTK